MNLSRVLQFYFFLTFTHYDILTSAKSIICSSDAPVQYFRLPKLHRCNYHRQLNEKSKVVSYEVYKPNIIEYSSEAKLCKKLVSEVSMYTDFSGYEHLVEKELNHRSISLAECREWIANKKCEYGSLMKAASNGVYSTNNKVEVDYPNRFTSFFSPKRYYKENCVIIETKVYSHFNQSRPSNILSDLSNCKYQDGSCPIKKNEIMIWDANKDQNCQYISIGKLDGIMSNGLWINSKNQIALSLGENKIVRDCNVDLLISDEGFAVKEIQKLPSESKIPRSIGLTQQALTSESKIPRSTGLTSTPSLQEMSINPLKYAESSTPRSEGLYQKEREEYYKKQQEQIQRDRELREQQIQKDRNRIQTEKDKEVRDKYEADRREFEKRREEKMKQYLEFEKRKKEKMERQGLLNTTTTSVNSNKIKDSEIQRIETTNRIKRFTKSEILRSERSVEANQSLEDTSRPFPLPTYEEYSKIKNDCLLLPSYADYLRSKDKEISDFVQSKDLEVKDFEKQREACDTFPSYDEYVTKFAEYALKEFENRKSDSKNPRTSGLSKRTRRQVYSDFQAAGEFQYLENKSNNLLRHTTEVMCDIFNEHSSLLETLIRDNPRRYIQKQLNHSAIKVKVLEDNYDSNSLGIVQVTFCKSLEDEDQIEFIDLTHFGGFKASLALTQGQIPIKIKDFGDKIWYYKESTDIISSEIQLHPKFHPRKDEITNIKSFTDFNLDFLDDKVIFHEHILLDTKTNIEEELINEMREKANVSVDLHSNSQDALIPHEILDEVSSIFEKYYIKIWRIYVTIGVTLFYIFIGRSIWMVLSPKTFFKSEGSGNLRFFDSRKNRNSRNRNSIFVRTKNEEGVEMRDLNEHRRSLVVD